MRVLWGGGRCGGKVEVEAFGGETGGEESACRGREGGFRPCSTCLHIYLSLLCTLTISTPRVGRRESTFLALRSESLPQKAIGRDLRQTPRLDLHLHARDGDFPFS